MNTSLNPKNPILLVDDDRFILKSYEIVLKSNGFNNILSCFDSRDVVSLLDSKKIELIILDLTMPHLSGEELLPQVTKNFPDIPILIITGNMEMDSAINCIKGGAFDYLVKPIDEDRFISSVKNALKRKTIEKENKALKEQLLSYTFSKSENFSKIITDHPQMISIFKYISAVANTSEPILITGETGVGKELVAGAIHKESSQKGPFIPESVSGLDDNIFSDTLFGHKKGAFTDAGESRKGLVEEARGGTLFLDEIGDLSQNSQIKLLRLLQGKEYRQLGSDIIKHSDAKIIAATNCDLKKLTESGKFRKDLYYRLDVHHIHIPPLRERLSDLPILVEHFIEEAEKNFGRKGITYQKEILSMLSNYSFPGNIRELRSIIFDSFSKMKGNQLRSNDFKIMKKIKGDNREPDPMNINHVYNGINIPTLAEIEKIFINKALIHTNGNQVKAADILGISRQTLIRKLKQS
ncbi:MAG: sigma-54 dependent transcriptional regulator [Acidobacteriota bacterium]